MAPDRPRIIAHRGSSGTAPENTMAAFRLAASEGAFGIELDVHLTADGIAAVCHDGHLLRTTGVDGRIGQMDWDDLSRLDAGSWKGPQYAGERIPRLSEVLAFCRRTGLWVNIELKGEPEPTESLVDAVIRDVQDARMTGAVLLSSFHHGCLLAADDRPDGLPVGLLSETLDEGLWELLEERAERGRGLLSAVHPHHAALSRPDAVRLHDMGYRINLWTVNEPGDAARYAEWGADALITDHPARLLAFLESRRAGNGRP